MEPPVQFTQRAARKIVQATRKTLTGTPLTEDPPQSLRRDRRYIGKLTSALTAPSNGWTGATTATVVIMVPSRNTITDPATFVESGRELTVVNRDPSREGDVGAWCKIEFVNNEWSFYDVECP